MKVVKPVLAALCLMIPFGLQAQTPSLEQLWSIVQQQQTEIAELQEALKVSQQDLKVTQQQLAEQNDTQETKIANTQIVVEQALEALDSRVVVAGTSKTTVGGYGELHYNNTDSKEEIDLHRFVMFLNHQFTDDLNFYSELEVEHSIAGDGQAGEVEVEQAFIQWDYAANQSIKGGMFLIPVGVLNETHEPDTFYGVERNAIEKNILPTTWLEGGIGVDGELAPGWRYDFAMHSGLKLDTDNASASKRSNIRSARQKVGKAVANDFAYTGRIRFNGIPGFQWSASLQYQSDLAQSDADDIGIGTIDATLLETNISIQRGGFGLIAVYARWDIDDEIERLNPGSNKQTGWYVEPSYRFDKLGLFARYGSYDLTAGSSASSDERNQYDVGFNYWLHDNVVLKADYQVQDNDRGNDVNGFNLGIGYSF